MKSPSSQWLELQLRLLALNSLLECARAGGLAETWHGPTDEPARFDLDTLQNLDFLFRDGRSPG